MSCKLRLAKFAKEVRTAWEGRPTEFDLLLGRCFYAVVASQQDIAILMELLDRFGSLSLADSRAIHGSLAAFHQVKLLDCVVVISCVASDGFGHISSLIRFVGNLAGLPIYRIVPETGIRPYLLTDSVFGSSGALTGSATLFGAGFAALIGPGDFGGGVAASGS